MNCPTCGDPPGFVPCKNEWHHSGARPASAQEFVASRLEPDPNHPDDDTFCLHFPHGGELVEGRDFWLRHLTELLDEYAAHWRKRAEQAEAERDALRKALAGCVDALRALGQHKFPRPYLPEYEAGEGALARLNKETK